MTWLRGILLALCLGACIGGPQPIPPAVDAGGGRLDGGAAARDSGGGSDGGAYLDSGPASDASRADAASMDASTDAAVDGSVDGSIDGSLDDGSVILDAAPDARTDPTDPPE